MQERYEYWYDPKHTGALRIIDLKNKIIYGSDPNEKKWIVNFEFINNDKLKVNFKNKKTHRFSKILYATYSNRKNSLLWSNDEYSKNYGNEWKRLRVDPRFVLSMI